MRWYIERKYQVARERPEKIHVAPSTNFEEMKTLLSKILTVKIQLFVAPS